MMLVTLAEQFAQTPAGAIVIPLVSASILAIAAAMVKMMLDVASLKQNVQEISKDIVDIKTDSDTMKWSTYHNREHRKRSRPNTPGSGQ